MSIEVSTWVRVINRTKHTRTKTHWVTLPTSNHYIWSHTTTWCKWISEAAKTVATIRKWNTNLKALSNVGYFSQPFTGEALPFEKKAQGSRLQRVAINTGQMSQNPLTCPLQERRAQSEMKKKAHTNWKTCGQRHPQTMALCSHDPHLSTESGSLLVLKQAC